MRARIKSSAIVSKAQKRAVNDLLEVEMGKQYQTHVDRRIEQLGLEFSKEDE